MKIFLDDLREFPKENYECVRTYEDCVMLLRLFGSKVEIINLDYDLCSKKTGLDVLKYMHNNNMVPKTIIVHSTHSTGVSMMERYIKEHFKYSSYLYRPL